VSLGQYFKNVLLGVLVLPLQDPSLWKLEEYSKIPKNEVTFQKSGMEIKVRKSASPIFYSFERKYKISGFKITGEFKGLPNFKVPADQGTKRADDYPLRIGLIVSGDKKLSGLKKLFVPDWVIRLYAQIPSEFGLDHVHFFNVTQNKNQIGLKRIHPSSNLITEEFIGLVEKPGPFKFEQHLKEPLPTLGIWLSVDGDDTMSEYSIILSNLELEWQE
jgi:hypothetical protein